MNEGLRMVHLRTVPDAWHAKVLAARLGCEGIITQLKGNVSGPYPFGAVSVLVEAGQAELAAELLLADEVEAAFAELGQTSRALDRSALGDDDGAAGDEDDSEDVLLLLDLPVPAGISVLAYPGVDLDLGCQRTKTASRWRRALAAAAALVVAGAPVLAHFVT